MKKAALYARVSSAIQRDENTIESQIVELKKQIVDNGHVLVKEYIDDGYSGTRLDRPALEQMRKDLKTNTFDYIYFLHADRIARDSVLQSIVISDILHYKKKLIINNDDYEHNPENYFKLKILGAVAELERAKIIERTTRGRRHRLRMGQISSQGCTTYGYRYIKKTETMPPQLVIYEPEAQIVRTVFEMYANGKYGLYYITKYLEELGAITLKGKKLWGVCRIKNMLNNETYAGVRHFNRLMKVKEIQKTSKYGKTILRNKSEWISVKVPAIVSRELFEKVQERINHNKGKYRNKKAHRLLSDLVRCGECGHSMPTYRRYVGFWRKTGIRRVFHKAAYKCSWRTAANMHSPKNVERCHNPEIIAQRLENKVMAMIKETMCDVLKLKGCMEFFKSDYRLDQKRVEWKFMRLEKKEKRLDKEKKQLIDQFASEKITQQEYVEKNVILDQQLLKAKNKRSELLRKIPLLHKKEIVDFSMRQFCDGVKAGIEKCYDDNEKRKFVLAHVERVIYKKYKVTIIGSVPIRTADQDNESKIPFQISGEIDTTMLHRGPRKYFKVDGRLNEYGKGGRDAELLKLKIKELQKGNIDVSELRHLVS